MLMFLSVLVIAQRGSCLLSLTGLKTIKGKHRIQNCFEPRVVTQIGISGTPPPLLSNLNLILQIIILGLLGLAVYFRFKNSLVRHGFMMGAAIGLHTAAIFGIMVPSMLGLDGLLGNFMTNFALITLTHAALGTLVEIMGVWLIVAWLHDSSRAVGKCSGRKNIMRITIILWLAELALGLLVYTMLYT